MYNNMCTNSLVKVAQVLASDLLIIRYDLSWIVIDKKYDVI